MYLCTLLPCFVKTGKIDYPQIAKIWLVKFCKFNFKIVYLAQFSTDFNNFDLKIEVGICSIQSKRNSENLTPILFWDTTVLVLTRIASEKNCSHKIQCNNN